MTNRIFLLLAAAAAALPVQASTLYKCVGPDGRTTYTNQNLGKHCEVISQDSPVTIFSPPPAPRPRQATPADFPRVDADQQRARDNNRRAILEKELANEQKNLESARRELATQENLFPPEERIAGGGIQGARREARLQSHRDTLRLHERNIESISRELARLK